MEVKVSTSVYWGLQELKQRMLGNAVDVNGNVKESLKWANRNPKEFVDILKGNVNISIKPDKAKVFVDEHIYDCLMSMSIEDNLKPFNIKHITSEYEDALEWIDQFPMTYTDVLLGRAELIKNNRV